LNPQGDKGGGEQPPLTKEQKKIMRKHRISKKTMVGFLRCVENLARHAETERPTAADMQAAVDRGDYDPGYW